MATHLEDPKTNKALDEVRAGESRRMASGGRTPLLKKSRWLRAYLYSVTRPSKNS